MRIIAGNMKGRKLNSPKDNAVRPTSDKVKEAVFSMIGEYIDGASVIDLFAGSGNLGLEALSRGANVCYFCDNSDESIRLLKSNIELCKAGGRSRIFHGDFRKALSGIPEKADIIFLDPPYEKELLEKCFINISETGALKEGGIIVAEHDGKMILCEIISSFNKMKEKKYGKVFVSLYS